MKDFLIPVAFDVEAETREEAAALVRETLRMHDGAHYKAAMDNARQLYRGQVEAWWFPAAEDKHVDGNDRPALALVPEEDDPMSVPCGGCGAAAGEVCRWSCTAQPAAHDVPGLAGE